MYSLPAQDALLPLNTVGETFTGRKSGMPTLDSAALFAGRHEVVITHGSETYLLRLTRQNRLILTK